MEFGEDFCVPADEEKYRRDHGWPVPILLEAAPPSEMRLGCVAQSNASGDVGGVLGITGPFGCDGLELMNMFMLSRDPTRESAQARPAATTVADKLLIAGLRMRCAPLASVSIDLFYKTREAVEQQVTEVLLRRCWPREPNSFFYRKIFRPTHASSEELSR